MTTINVAKAKDILNGLNELQLHAVGFIVSKSVNGSVLNPPIRNPTSPGLQEILATFSKEQADILCSLVAMSTDSDDRKRLIVLGLLLEAGVQIGFNKKRR